MSVTIVDVRLKSNLKINQTLILTEKFFFYTILGFTRSHFYSLDDIDGFYQLIAGSYESEKPFNIIGSDKVHLKYDCIDSSIVNGTREPLSNSFALSSAPGHKIYKETRIKLFKKIHKSVLSHITFYLEDDDQKSVDFNRETISFTRQIIKKQYSFLYELSTNLNMNRVKNRTEDLLLPITKNCETLIEQTHSKAEQTLEFKMIEPAETSHFNPLISTEGSWMIGFTYLEVYNSIFNITEEINKFELYKFPDEKAGGVSYGKVRDDFEKDLDISDITAADSQNDIIGPNIIEDYKEQVTKRREYVCYMHFLRIIQVLYFKISNVISEQKMIWIWK